MKTLKDINVIDKRVLVRCDFNVPVDNNGEILDDFRIVKSLPTINYLVKEKAKAILMSHLDPEGTGVADSKFSLRKVAEKLSEHLNMPVAMADDCIGPEIENQSSAMKGGDVLLLENLRFHKEETHSTSLGQADEEFAKKLSYLGDIYVNDAFSVCHRNHVSIVLLPKLLPSCAGLLLQKEIENLNKVLYSPERPMVVLIGGKKVETKVKFINKISEIADWVIISGPIKKEAIEKKVEFLHAEKIIGPEDNLDSYGLDEKSVKVFCQKIMQAKTVLWNGPFTKFEEKKYEEPNRFWHIFGFWDCYNYVLGKTNYGVVFRINHVTHNT